MIVKDPERCKACLYEPECCPRCDNKYKPKSAASVTEDALKQLVFTMIDNSAKQEKE